MLALCYKLPSLLLQKKHYFILTRLFRKHNSAFEEHLRDQTIRMEAETKPGSKAYVKPEENNDPDKPILDDEDRAPYDFMERTKEVESEKIVRQKLDGIIPEDIRKGGINEIVYWSTQAHSIKQIEKIIRFFNDLKTITEPENMIHFSEFLEKVNGSVYMATSFDSLKQYALFGFKFNLDTEVYWEKIAEKTRRLVPETSEEKNALLDIGFVMSKTGFGIELYANVEKYCMSEELNVEQLVKCALMFFELKIGSESWKSELINRLIKQMHKANNEELAELLPALKCIKTIPTELAKIIAYKAEELASTYEFHQIINVIEYFEKEDLKSLEEALESRMLVLLQKEGLELDLEKLESIIRGVLPTYKFSKEFIQRYVIDEVHKFGPAGLRKMRLSSLSGLSKSLYVYMLEAQSEDINLWVTEILIERMMKEHIENEELVTIIKDFNVTRHAPRRLFVFFEELINERYLLPMNRNMDKTTLCSLKEIYSASELCSASFLKAINNML